MTLRWPWVTAVLALTLILAAAAALLIGVAATSPEVVWNIRAPRIAMAVIVGAGLAVAGALMQGSLGNPLADPALVGVSGGAALGTVAAVALGGAFNTGFASLAACLGAAGAVAVVVGVSIRDSRPEVVTLLLAGVAVTAFTTAALAVLVSMSDVAGARSVTFWTTGSLALATWGGVLSVAPFAVIGLALAATTPRSLDALSLGDRAAQAVGVDVAGVRYRALAAVVLLVAAGVATVGIIASVSDPFCSACDRTRLTADGQVRNCLFATAETDLRSLLRAGEDDARIELAWRTAMWSKAAGHGINTPGFVQPQRPMSAIGG